jgi:hypothetical protein
MIDTILDPRPSVLKRGGSMGRLIGNILLWVGLLMAGGWVWLNYTSGTFRHEYFGRDWVTPIVPAVMFVVAGLAARYTLARGKK